MARYTIRTFTFRISLLMALVCATTSARAQTCEAFFRSKPATSVEAALETSDQTSAFLIGYRQARAKPTLNHELVETEIRNYQNAKPGERFIPRTPEASLAYFLADAMKSGRDLETFTTWFRQATPKQRAPIAKAFSRIDFTKGVSPSQARYGYSLLFAVTHSNPAKLSALLETRSLSASALQLLTQELEFRAARDRVLDTIINDGFEKKPSTLEGWRHLNAKYANVRALLNSVVMNWFTGNVVGLPLLAPNIRLLRSTSQLTTAELMYLLDHSDAEALKAVKKSYLAKAYFDVIYPHAARAYTLTLMTYVMATVLPVLIPAMVPSDLRDKHLSPPALAMGTAREYGDWVSSHIGATIDAAVKGKLTDTSVPMTSAGENETPPAKPVTPRDRTDADREADDVMQGERDFPSANPN